MDEIFELQESRFTPRKKVRELSKIVKAKYLAIDMIKQNGI